MQITVQVSQHAAPTLHQRAPPTPEAEKLLELVRKLGVELEPVHPGEEDPNLAPFFTVEAPDREMADCIAAELQRCGAIEAAYIKPPADLP
jgi:hypothetical protein